MPKRPKSCFRNEKQAALEARRQKAEEKAKGKAAEAEKKAKEDAAQAAIQAAAKKSDAETVALLTEIRDLLKKTA